MAAALRELRDPAGLALALLTGLVNWALGVRLALAVGAAVAVLGVRLVAGVVWPRQTPSPPRGGTVASSIVTRRELQIAEHVADGLSNREIATKLFLSERTVDNHVQHLLNKLTFRSRAQIAAWVARHRESEK